MSDAPAQFEVFLSHFAEERSIAECIQDYLRLAFGNDLRVFRSSDDGSIATGKDQYPAILQALGEASVYIVLVSKYSASRPWLTFEAGYGKARGVELFPVLVWENLSARLTRPMHLRLIIQPTVATILAIRAGLRDAHQNRPAFLWGVIWHPAHRRELLREGWKDVGKVFLIAAILDVIYQLIVHRRVYIPELLITAVALAVIPYVLFRGPISRVARVVFGASPPVKQPAKQRLAR